MNPKSTPIKTDMPEIIITPVSSNAIIPIDTDDKSSSDRQDIALPEAQLAYHESKDNFFFSNMLRSLIPKTRHIHSSGAKKCRAETTDKPNNSPVPHEKGMNKLKLKKSLQEQLKKCTQTPSSSSPQPSPLLQHSPLWSPLTLPWFWPTVDLQNACFLPSGLWEASNSVLSNGQRLFGKAWRDVPLEHLFLRQHNQHALELTSSTITSTQSILRRRVKKKSSFQQHKLAVGTGFRSHHSSAFTTPQKLLRKNADRDMKALDLSVSAVILKDKTAPNVHYVMSNLRSIFHDITSVTKLSTNGSDCSSSPSKSDSNKQEDKNTQTADKYSPNCKKFSALIGLEIVVDYVKQTDHS